MVVGPLPGIPAFNGVAAVVPFTYRDVDTNLQILKRLCDKINDVIDSINVNADVNTTEHNRIVTDLTQQFNDALNALEASLSGQIAELSLDHVSVVDPTTGTRDAPLTTALSNTYDNARVFAWFAGQLDDFGWTAEEYENHIDTARHFDLAPTYPALNDVLPA